MFLVPVATSRLRFRALQPSDCVAVFDVLGDGHTTRLVSWRQPTLESTASYIQRRMHDQSRYGMSMWAVELLTTGELAGLCGFFPQNDVVAELGYVIQARHWGNGYGAEAARAAVEALTTTMPDVTVFATIRMFNTWSLGVARSIGLDEAGDYTDERGEMLVFRASNETREPA